MLVLNQLCGFGVGNQVLTLGSIVVDAPGSAYTSAPDIGFTGGGGSGAAATANMHLTSVGGTDLWSYPSGGWDQLWGYDYTSVPTTFTWTGSNIITPPTTSASLCDLYEYTAANRNGTVFVYGSGVADGTYSVGGYNGAIGDLITPIASVTIVSNAITAISMSNLGLTTTSIRDLFSIGTYPNSLMFGIDSSLSTRKGLIIHYSGGSLNSAAAPSLSVSGGSGGTLLGASIYAPDHTSFSYNIYEVGSVTVTNAGSGFTSAPLISFSGGGGSSAAAHAVMTG